MSKKVGSTYEVLTGCGNMIITIPDNLSDGKVRVKLAKAGSCAFAQCETIGRLMTLALNAGVAVERVGIQLAGIRCPQPLQKTSNSAEVLSCADAVSQTLVLHMESRKES
jgi:ribonucleoside-diphosphate reductase alpha chain